MTDFEMEATIPGHHDGSEITGTIEEAGGTNVRVSGPGWSADRRPQTGAWADVTPNAAPVVQDALQGTYPGTRITERLKR